MSIFLFVVIAVVAYRVYSRHMSFHRLDDKAFSAVIDGFIASDALMDWDKADCRTALLKLRALNFLMQLKLEHLVEPGSRTDRCINEVLDEMVPSLGIRDNLRA